MKKYLFSIFGLTTMSFGLFGQTWNFSNEPSIDATTTMYLVDTTAANLGNISGSGQTWDFSALGGYEDNTRILSVIDPTGDVSFPNASHMLMIPGFVNTAYTYEEGTNDKLAHGYQFELPDLGVVTFVFSDLQKMLQFPTTLGTTFTDNMSGTLTIFDEDNQAEGQTWVTADGTGTLILANGVQHTNVLRIQTLDTLYADITLTILPVPTSVTIVRETFDYVKDGTSDFSLFTHASLKILNPIIGEIKITVVLSSENPTVFANIDNNTIAAVQVYPNPSNGVFTVSNNDAIEAAVSVVDVTGRVVFVAAPSNENIQVDLSQELPGIYFVNVVRAGITTVEKVIIK